jgi:hypothetical protein
VPGRPHSLRLSNKHEHGCKIPYLPVREKESENRVVRRICEPKRDEMTGGWRQLHNEDFIIFRSIYPSIIRVITSTKMKWVGHVARMC